MKKFWIAFDKRNSRTLLLSEDKQKTIDYAKSYLTENPAKSSLFVLEAVAMARLTAAPIEVTEISEPAAPPKSEEAQATELVDRLRTLEGHSDPKAEGPVDEPKDTANLNSLSDLYEAKTLNIFDEVNGAEVKKAAPAETVKFSLGF